jgi:hypothetical protein
MAGTAAMGNLPASNATAALTATAGLHISQPSRRGETIYS